MEWIWVVVLGVPAALAVGASYRRRVRQRGSAASRVPARRASNSSDYHAAYLVYGGDGGAGHGAFGGDARMRRRRWGVVLTRHA